MPLNQDFGAYGTREMIAFQSHLCDPTYNFQIIILLKLKEIISVHGLYQSLLIPYKLSYL